MVGEALIPAEGVSSSTGFFDDTGSSDCDSEGVGVEDSVTLVEPIAVSVLVVPGTGAFFGAVDSSSTGFCDGTEPSLSEIDAVVTGILETPVDVGSSLGGTHVSSSSSDFGGAIASETEVGVMSFVDVVRVGVFAVESSPVFVPSWFSRLLVCIGFVVSTIGVLLVVSLSEIGSTVSSIDVVSVTFSCSVGADFVVSSVGTGFDVVSSPDIGFVVSSTEVGLTGTTGVGSTDAKASLDEVVPATEELTVMLVVSCVSSLELTSTTGGSTGLTSADEVVASLVIGTSVVSRASVGSFPSGIAETAGCSGAD